MCHHTRVWRSRSRIRESQAFLFLAKLITNVLDRDVHILNSSGPVHEMDAPTQEQGGFMNLIRKASTRKSGGVERYG